MARTSYQTYDFICFSSLLYELSDSESVITEKKIKRLLRYYGLGPYQQERIDLIRAIKEDLRKEFSLRAKSQYFVDSENELDEMEDFELDKMKSDYLKKYKSISDTDMMEFLKSAIYLYYLR